MQTLALTLILLSIPALAIQTPYARWLQNERGFTDLELLFVKCGIGALVCFLPYLLMSGYFTALGTKNPDPAMYWIAVVGVTLANFVIQWANMRAAKLADVSFSAPISATTPGFVTVTGVVLGEWPSTLGYFGIGLIVMGTFLHAREGAPLKEYFTPFYFWRAIRSEELPEEERKKYRGLALAYVGAFYSTFGLTLDGVLPRYGNPALGVSIELASLAVIYLAFYVKGLGLDWRGTIAAFRRRALHNWEHLVGLGISFGSTFIMLTVVYTEAPIAYAGSMKRLAIILTVLIGIYKLGELRKPDERGKRYRRLILSGVVVLGSVFLALDDVSPVVISNLDEFIRTKGIEAGLVLFLLTAITAYFTHLWLRIERRIAQRALCPSP